MVRKTVLLVEDHDDSRKICATILRHHGFSILEAGTGEDGIRLAHERVPDLILMDISLPGVDGLRATACIREDSSTRHIPIVAFTAHALAGDREKSEGAGCDSYLAKPCTPMRVLQEVITFIGPADIATASDI